MADPIHKILSNIFPEEHRWKMDLLERWEGLIGNLKDKVSIEKIERDVLTLGVVHPAWSQELFFLSDFLKDKINTALKAQRIKKIRFKTKGDVRKRVVATKKITQAQVDVCDIDENIALPVNGEKSLQLIKSEECRQALQRYYIRCCGKKRES